MKKAGSVLFTLIMLTIVALSFGGSVQVNAASAKTGVGLSDHVLKAYNDGWKYSYGAYGQISGKTRITDCSGLIKSYLWWVSDSSNPKPGLVSVGGGASAMLNSAKEKGTIDYSNASSLPRIHGLILYQPGHVGVYVGNNMAVDNRDVGYDVKYEKVFGRARKKWTTWFKLPQITYPTNGFATYNGNQYYYKDGQYVVNTTLTISGVKYTFGADGIVKGQTKVTQAQQTVSKAVSSKPVAVSVQKKPTASAKAKGTVTVTPAQSKTKNEVTSVQPTKIAVKDMPKTNSKQGSTSLIVKEDLYEPEKVEIVSFTQEKLPVAAAMMQPKIEKVAQEHNNFAFILVFLFTIVGAVFIVIRRLNKTISVYRYLPTNEMRFKKSFQVKHK